MRTRVNHLLRHPFSALPTAVAVIVSLALAVVARGGDNCWNAYGSGLSNEVFATAIYNGSPVVGGSFGMGIRVWNGSDWVPLGGGINGTVRALLVHEGDLYVGGTFSAAGGASISGVAKWNGSSWSGFGSGTPATVNALTFHNGDLVAGGTFDSIGGVTASKVARWNGSTWIAYASGLNDVRTLAVFQGQLHVGGFFLISSGHAADYFARWNGSGWDSLGGALNGAVRALVVYGDDLVVGGGFLTATFQSVARWTGTSWIPFTCGPTATTLALTVQGTDLIAAGFFQFFSCGGALGRIARFDGTTWSALATGVDSIVNALASDSRTILVGGNFTTAGGIRATRVAAWECPPGCGSPWLGSCFSSSNDPFCSAMACCEEVCGIDGSCCEVAWDLDCVALATSGCLSDVPLCAGSARQFSGGGSALVESFGLHAPTQEITIEFWQRLDSHAPSTEATVIRCQSGSNTNRIVVHSPWWDGNVYFDFGSIFAGGRIAIPAPAGIGSGWHHFAFVASNSGQFMRVYYDGQLIGSTSIANPFIPVDAPLLLSSNVNPTHFNGAIDELRIWSTARSSDEIGSTWNRTVPPDSSDLLAYYRMDSDLETTLLVNSAPAGGSLPATLSGSSSMVSGACSVEVCDLAAVDFDGVTGYIDVGSMGDFGAGVTSSTVEFWFRTTRTDVVMAPIKIIDDRPGSDDPVFAVEFNRALDGCSASGLAPGKTLFFLRDDNGKVRAAMIDEPFFDGAWHHLAWRIDEAAPGLPISAFVDGLPVVTTEACDQGASAFTPWIGALAIGAANNRGTIEAHFDGAIDDVRLWDHPRSSAEIFDTYFIQVAPSAAGLVGYWRMEEGLGTLTYDYAGSNHGVLVGGSGWGNSRCVPPVLGDLNDDGVVDGADLGILLGNWGLETSLGDLDQNGLVDGADLGILLGEWS